MQPTQTTPERDPYLWKQAKARVGFRMHLRSYLIVNVGLWLLWAVINFTARESHDGTLYPWPIWTTLGWGIGLAAHYFSVFYGSSEKSMIESEYEKLKNRQY